MRLRAVRVIIIEGNDLWVERTLEHSFVRPGKPYEITPSDRITEVARAVEKVPE